jgi:hypothetical protein
MYNLTVKTSRATFRPTLPSRFSRIGSSRVNSSSHSIIFVCLDRKRTCLSESEI